MITTTVAELPFLLPSIVIIVVIQQSRSQIVSHKQGVSTVSTGAYTAKLSRDLNSKGVDIMVNTLDVFKKFYSELTEVLPMIITGLVIVLA